MPTVYALITPDTGLGTWQSVHNALASSGSRCDVFMPLTSLVIVFSIAASWQPAHELFATGVP